MTRLSPLNFDADGYTHVPLTVDQVELIGDALECLAHSAPGRASDVAALARCTGLLITDSNGA